MALPDVDGDGDLDIVLGKEFRQNVLYLNDGTGAFSDATADLPVDKDLTHGIAIGDIDGDQDVDLVLANQTIRYVSPAGTSRVYVNRRRQIDAPFVAIGGRGYELRFYADPGNGSAFRLAIPFLAPAERTTMIPPFGQFGLDLSQAIVLPLLVIQPNNRFTTLTLKLPNLRSMQAATLSSQALIVPDLSYPPTSWRFTNVNADRIIR